MNAIEFEDYILVMSLHRPLTAIRVMENDPAWQESVPYSYPQCDYRTVLFKEPSYAL